MSIVDSIRKDMFMARKEGRVSQGEILGMALASVKNAEIDKGELNDEQVQEILRKEVKKLEDAFDQYTKGGRKDLANREKEQIETLSVYLPALMSDTDVRSHVKGVVDSNPNASLKDMGLIIGLCMKELKGKADGGLVSRVVKEFLESR